MSVIVYTHVMGGGCKPNFSKCAGEMFELVMRTAL